MHRAPIDALKIQWLLIAADQTQDYLERAGFERLDWREQPYWRKDDLIWCYGGIAVATPAGYLSYRMGAPQLSHNPKFCLPPFLYSDSTWINDGSALDPLLQPVVNYEVEYQRKSGGFWRRRVLMSHYGFPALWQAAWWIQIMGRVLPHLDDDLYPPRWEFVPQLRSTS
jgi:hypothetical protein